jgi:hypothetical protein
MAVTPIDRSEGPRGRTERVRLELNPDAAGVEAFWDGRPIWANPLTGEPARQWAAGWKTALRDLTARCGDIDPSISEDSMKWLALLRANRPDAA